MEMVRGGDGIPVHVVQRVGQIGPEQMQGGPFAVRPDRQYRHRRWHIGFAHHEASVDAGAAQQRQK
jgi:hypothetical protein